MTLGPEGGAHQSVITPSIGIEQPGCVAYEPAFGQDLEWCLLHALSRLGRPGRRVGVLPPLDAADRPGAAHRARARRRSPAATALARREPSRSSSIAVMGALVPEALAAADMLAERGGRSRPRSSASRAPTCCSARSRRAPGSATATRGRSTRLFPHDVPIVTLRRRPPAHARLPRAARIACLGVQRFGQSGDLAELYEHHQIDAESVVGAALDLLAPTGAERASCRSAQQARTRAAARGAAAAGPSRGSRSRG